MSFAKPRKTSYSESNELIQTVRKCWQLCQQVARIIPPERADKLLFMTAASESDFKWRRQQGLKPDSIVGGFSLWQLEPPTILFVERLLQWRKNWAQVRVALFKWLEEQGLSTHLLLPYRLSDLLSLLQVPDGDVYGCVLARLKYLSIPEPLPYDISEMAKYAKRYYNTYLGKATPERYERKFWEYWKYVSEDETATD